MPAKDPDDRFPPPTQDPETVRAWDRRAASELGLAGIVLMENAGAEVARWLLERRARGEIAPPWRILCGPGNNGGDGFVVTRHLEGRGERVEVYCPHDPDRPGDSDATINFRILERAAISCARQAAPPEPFPSGGTWIDALLGTGLTRRVEGVFARWVEALNSADTTVVSLDLPSGLDARTGQRWGVAVRAQHTLTFAATKHGLERGAGPEHAGEVEVLPIGLPRSIWAAPP